MKSRQAAVKIAIISTILLTGCRTTERDWKRATEGNTAAAYSHFLARHPHSAHANDAKAAIENLDWNEANSTNKPLAFLGFYRRHPESFRITVAQGVVASKLGSTESPSAGSFFQIIQTVPVIAIDGAKVDISAEDACQLGIFECDATLSGSPDFKTRPARSAKIVKERATGRILAVDLPATEASVPGDAIHDATVSGDLEEVKLLITNNPNLVFGKDAAGHTPLLEATSWGHKDIAELLLANHADVNNKDKDTDTPLSFAAANGHKDVAELLLANHADVNAKNNIGMTPLHQAAVYGHKDVAELLLAFHADVNAKENYGQTPLHLAAANGHKDVAELLLANKADVNLKDNGGDTPLHSAANNGHKDVAELLLASKAEVNARNNSGQTPLHSAATNGDKEMAELLLSYKAEVNAKDNDGETPFAAAMKGMGVKAWLLAGKSREIKDKTASDNYNQLLALLFLHGGTNKL